jgi:quinol-cytochrome oxidoreductase complex cytochrome b subunit
MIAAVFMHMMRVYFVGAYKKPREFNWVLGTVLLGVTLGFGYTGYLLPWDQLGYWAGTIGLEMAKSLPIVGELAANIVFGGTALSGSTVTRMYYLHVYILPLMGGALMILHMVIVYIQGLAEPH